MAENALAGILQALPGAGAEISGEALQAVFDLLTDGVADTILRAKSSEQETLQKLAAAADMEPDEVKEILKNISYIMMIYFWDTMLKKTEIPAENKQ